MSAEKDIKGWLKKGEKLNGKIEKLVFDRKDDKVSESDFAKKLNRFVAETAKFYSNMEKKTKKSGDDKSVKDFYDRFMKPTENAFDSAMGRK